MIFFLFFALMGVASRQIGPKRLETKLERTNKPISSTARLSQLIPFPFFILTGRDQIIQIDECRILAEKTLRGLFRSTGGGTQRRRRQRIPQQVQLEGIVRVVVGAVRCRRFRRVPVPVRYHVELVQVRRRALAGRRPRVVPGLGMGRRCRRRRVSQPSPWIRLRHGMGRLPRVARRRRRIAGWGRGERVRLPW
jgi:hypothetical protein